MCGIAGAVANNSNTCEKVKIMTAALQHRGPDDCGYWENENTGVFLGHRRLSIQDTSCAAKQPMLSRSGRYILVFNGEIYNFLEIKSSLQKNHNSSFSNGSDTAVILELFDLLGINKSIKIIEGMFSIAVYDSKNNTLSLIRDRVGEKPLYYSFNNGELYFASELKSFEKSACVNLEIDSEAISLYLSSTYIPSPYTIYRNIKKLPPASILTYTLDEKKISIHSYWSCINTYENNDISFNDAINKLDKLIHHSVNNQKIADVNIGCFLSGGIDSSLIASILQHQSDTPINTFTIGFDDKIFDESESAQKVANHLGTNHECFLVTEKDALKVIENLMDIYDEPFSDSSCIPSLLLSEKVGQKVKVALSGDGGDELFNGYTRHKVAFEKDRILRNIPFKKLFSKLLENEQFKHVLNRYQSHSNHIAGLRNYLKNPSFLSTYSLIESHLKNNEFVTGYDFKVNSKRFLNNDLYKTMCMIDIDNCLSGDMLVKIDRASMHYSLETRAPLLDKNIIEFALSLPHNYKINTKTGKLIVREVLYQYIPKEIIEKPKKGFSIPLFKWLQGPLKGLVLEIIEKNIDKTSEYINEKWIRTVIHEFYINKKSYHYYIWDIFIVSLWFEKKT